MSDPNYAWQFYDIPLLAWPSSVLAKRNHPPDDASVNDCYIVGSDPSGEWIDRVNQIAVRNDARTWVYQQAVRGRRVYIHSTRTNVQFNGREWVEESGLPPGGLTGYVLAKATDADYDAEWIEGSTIPGVGGGGGAAPVILFAKDENVTGVYPEGTLGFVLGQGFGAYRQRGGIWEMVGSSWVYRGTFSQFGVPEGGTTGQVLGKSSNSDFALAWINPGEAGGDITSVTAGTGLSGGGSGGDVTLSVVYGTTSTSACVGNDTRLTNDRTASGLRTGSGVVSISAAAAPSTGQILVATSPTTATWQDPLEATGEGDITAVLAGDGLTGGATAGPATLAVDFGTGNLQVRHGDDASYTNDRIASGIRTASNIVYVNTAAAPEAGQALVATSPTTAEWQDVGGGGSGDITAVVAGPGLTGGATAGSATLSVIFGTGSGQVRPGDDPVHTDARVPTGSAGGDLGGTYPNPTVTAIRTGGTKLSIGTLVDGEFLQRAGTTIVSSAGISSPQPVQVNGSLIGTRNAIDVVAGSGISLSGTDDSANNRVRVTINSTGGGGGGGVTGGLYLESPLSPNTFDDEFDSGSPDLATRGWTFRNLTTGTTMTRVGDVYPYEYTLLGGSGTLGVNEYRSRIQNGRLVIQISTNATNEYACYKAVTLPTTSDVHGGVIWAKLASSRAFEGAGIHGFMGIAIWADAGGFPDLANRNLHQVYYSDTTSTLSYAGANDGDFVETTTNYTDSVPSDIFGIMTVASNVSLGTKFFRASSATGQDSSSAWKTGSTYKSAGSIAYAGFAMYQPSPTPARNSSGLRYIDFIRLRTGDMQDLCATSAWLYP